MSGSTPRRPASSRGGVQRPRKIAGQRDTARPDEAVEPAASTKGPTAKAPTAKAPTAKAPRTAGVSLAKAAGTPPPAPRPGVLARQKTTRVLIATLILVALALGSETVLFVLDKIGDDDPPAAREASGVAGVEVPEGRPVVAADIDVKEGVDAAAKAAKDIVAVDFQKYDAEVDEAADLMTTTFESSYRKTAEAIKQDFIANKTVVVASVVAQGVVRANRTRLQALVFLDQNVQRTREGKAEVVSTPFKVLVTMVHTDQGWLVDGLDTNTAQDKTN
ncbi:hypothetical protein CFH99_11600 [Nocardioides aromaticivorans]|uniref:Mce-associated membrane protein n=1 Tax=Nocardioides aromaticivorans TaxID=200618 RepID=A0ABX7PKR7_9ACTN|nr:hypothetical protein [Nocardioides aromaticivorans]QSR26273.1 hypothetical protein CFH99_11600 [Nocardioides aromaticivorans]